MRKLSLVVIAAMLLSMGSVFANDSKKDESPTKSLTEQIGVLLEQNNFTISEDGKTAEVIFTLNKQKEIVVLSVDAEDNTLDTFIKTRLNYQAVDVATFEEGKKYAVQVRITV